MVEKPTLQQKRFCALAYAKATERGLAAKHQCAKEMGISPARWIEITNGEVPNFSRLSSKAISGYVQTITRVCDFFELDLKSSLEMLGLPEEPVGIQNARSLRTGDIEIGLPEVEKLRQLVELTGKPIPLSFAENFLRRIRAEE